MSNKPSTESVENLDGQTPEIVEQANAALGVINKWVTTEFPAGMHGTVAPSFMMPTVEIDVLESAKQRANGNVKGARYKRIVRADRQMFVDNIFDRELTVIENGQGHIVLDLNPVKPGFPNLHNYDPMEAKGDEITPKPVIWFRGIPESSPLYDDLKSSVWALWSLPAVYQYEDSVIPIPSKREPNVLGIIRTFVDDDAAQEAYTELLQAVRQFCQASPEYRDGLEGDDPVRVSGMSGEVEDAPSTAQEIRQAARTRAAVERGF